MVFEVEWYNTGVIWIALFFIIILISCVLAFRSMRDYEEFPESSGLNSVFFIGNTANFTVETLNKLHKFLLNDKQFFSLERLYRGKERALVIFGPGDLKVHLPELNLVELEDYIDGEGVSVNQSLTWLIEAKNNPKKILHIGGELKNLEIGPEQKFFIQIVCMPLANHSESTFQATLRVMAVEGDPSTRIQLAKKVDQAFSLATGLNRHEDDLPEMKKFESFKQRSLIPKEVTFFPISAQEIFNILV